MERLEKETIEYDLLCAKLELAILNEKKEDIILQTSSGSKIGYKAILIQEINDLYEKLNNKNKLLRK